LAISRVIVPKLLIKAFACLPESKRFVKLALLLSPTLGAYGQACKKLAQEQFGKCIMFPTKQQPDRFSAL
jgi:hypothetical protein